MRNTDAIRQEIIRAARENGIDPATALAYAARESNFDPLARSSKTIRGLYQMRGDLRAKYGVGDADDAYTQTKGWGRFIGDVKKEMAGTLGRDPTDAEAYAGHHFGGKRAARMMRMDPNTPVDAVFTPYEMSINPHFAKAGTVGALTGSVIRDIDKRRASFGGAAVDLPDLSSFGDPVQQAEAPDLSSFGDPVGTTDNGTISPDQGVSAPDLSSFGTLAEPTQPAQSAPAQSAPDLSQLGTPT